MDSCSPTKDIKSKVIKFFSDVLEKQDEPVYYELIRGYVSGASEDVRSHIKKYCKGEDLLKYFKRRSNYYEVTRHGDISLKGKQIPAVQTSTSDDGDGNHLHETCEGKENDSPVSESNPHKSEKCTEEQKTACSKSENGDFLCADHAKNSAISKGIVIKKVTSKKEKVAPVCDTSSVKAKSRNGDFCPKSSHHSKAENTYHKSERGKVASEITSSKCENNRNSAMSTLSVTKKVSGNQTTVPSSVNFELEEQVLSYFIDILQKEEKMHYNLFQNENCPQNVEEFLSSNYPNDGLLEFFKSHSGTFVTTENGFVMLQKAHIHTITHSGHKIQKKEVQNFTDENCDSSSCSRSSSSSRTFTETEHMSKSSQENLLDADESDDSHKIPESVSHLIDESVLTNKKEISAVCFFAEVLCEKGSVILQNLKDMAKSSPEILWCSKLKIGKFKRLLQNYPQLFIIKRSSSVFLCKDYEPKLKCLQEKIRPTSKEEQKFDEIFSEDLSALQTPDGNPEICKLPSDSSKYDIPNPKSEQDCQTIIADSSVVSLHRSYETKHDSLQEKVVPTSYKEQEYDDRFCATRLSTSQIADKREPEIHMLPVESFKHDIPNCKSEQDCHIKITTCFKPCISDQDENHGFVHAANHSENDRPHTPEERNLSAEKGVLPVQLCTDSYFKHGFSNTSSFIPKSILLSENNSNICNSFVLPICNQNVSEESSGGDDHAKFLVIWAAEMLCMKIYEINKIFEHNAKQKAIDYFVSEIKNYFQKWVPYEYLKGKLGQAPPGISTYIKQKFPGREFSKFFLEHEEFKTLPAAVSLSKSYCDSSLKKLSDGNQSVSNSSGFQKLYDTDFFKLFHAICNAIKKLSSFICNKQCVSMDRLSGYLSSLSSAEKNVLQSFEGQSTVEKTQLFLSYFDGVFNVCEKFVHLCKGYDVLLKELEEHILKCLICSLVNDGCSTTKMLNDTICTSFPLFQGIPNVEDLIANHSSHLAADCGSDMQKYCSFKNHKLSVEVLNLIEEKLQLQDCLFYTELLSVIKTSPQLFWDMIHEMPVSLIYALKTNETFMCKDGKVFLRSHLEKPDNLYNGNCTNSVDSNQKHEINENALVLVTNACCLKNCGEHSDLTRMETSEFESELLVTLYRHNIESRVLTSPTSVVKLELCYLNISKLNCESVILEIHQFIAASSRKPCKKFIAQDFMCFLYQKFRHKYANLIFPLETLDNVHSEFLHFLNCLSSLKSCSLEKSSPNEMTLVWNKTDKNELKGSLEKDILSTVLTVDRCYKPDLQRKAIWSTSWQLKKTSIEPVLQYNEKSAHSLKPIDSSVQQVTDLSNIQEKYVINGIYGSENISERAILNNNCIVTTKTENRTSHKPNQKHRSPVTASPEVSFDLADNHNPSDYSPRTRIGSIVGFVWTLSRNYGAVQVTCSSGFPFVISFSKSVFLCAHKSFYEIKLMDKMFCLVPDFDRKKSVWKACLVIPMCCRTKLMSLPEIRVLGVEAITDVNDDEPTMSENGSLLQNHHDNVCDSSLMCGNKGDSLNDNICTDSCVSLKLDLQEVFQHNSHSSVLSHALPTCQYDSANQLPTSENIGLLQVYHNNSGYIRETHNDSDNIHPSNAVSLETYQVVQPISHSNDIVSAVLPAPQPHKSTSTQNSVSDLNESCLSGSAENHNDVTDSNKSVHAQPPEANFSTLTDADVMNEASSPDKLDQLSVRVQDSSLLSTDFVENTRHSISHSLCDASCQTISTGDIFSTRIFCD